MMRLLASLVLLAAFPARAGAPPAEGGALSLDEVVSLAIRDNAGIQSLRAKVRAMQERPAQAGALPNPMAIYNGMDSAGGGDWPDTGEKRFMVEQEFPWFGKQALKRNIADQEAAVMQRELAAMVREGALQARESYFELFAVQQAMAVTREEQGVLGRMAQVAETMYAAGSRPQTDALKARTEITMLEQKLQELQAQENTLKAKLNLLCARRADASLGPLKKPPEARFDEDAGALFALAEKNRPEIQAAQLQMKRYELEQKLMARESWPDYKLGLEYRSLREDDDMVMFTVGVELPIWRSKIRAAAREAEQMRASSQAARDAAEQQSAFDVQDALFKFQTARRTLELYRTELVPQAESRFSASEAGYRAGSVDFLDLLESERFLLDAKIMGIMAEGALGMRAARLEWATGTGVGGDLPEDNMPEGKGAP